MFNHKKNMNNIINIPKQSKTTQIRPSKKTTQKKKRVFVLKFVSPLVFHQLKDSLRFTFRPTPINWEASCGRFIEPAWIWLPIPGSGSPRGPSWIIGTPFWYGVKIKNTYLSCHQPEIWNYMKLYVKYDCCFSYDKNIPARNTSMERKPLQITPWNQDFPGWEKSSCPSYQWVFMVSLWECPTIRNASWHAPNLRKYLTSQQHGRLPLGQPWRSWILDSSLCNWTHREAHRKRMENESWIPPPKDGGPKRGIVSGGLFR